MDICRPTVSSRARAAVEPIEPICPMSLGQIAGDLDRQVKRIDKEIVAMHAAGYSAEVDRLLDERLAVMGNMHLLHQAVMARS